MLPLDDDFSWFFRIETLMSKTVNAPQLTQTIFIALKFSLETGCVGRANTWWSAHSQLPHFISDQTFIREAMPR